MNKGKAKIQERVKEIKCKHNCFCHKIRGNVWELNQLQRNKALDSGYYLSCPHCQPIAPSKGITKLVATSSKLVVEPVKQSELEAYKLQLKRKIEKLKKYNAFDERKRVVLNEVLAILN